MILTSQQYAEQICATIHVDKFCSNIRIQNFTTAQQNVFGRAAINSKFCRLSAVTIKAADFRYSFFT